MFVGERGGELELMFFHMIAHSVRYLKFYKRCLSDRKKLGIGCSEVEFIS